VTKRQNLEPPKPYTLHCIVRGALLLIITSMDAPLNSKRSTRR